MQKNHLGRPMVAIPPCRYLTKAFRIMKLTVLLMIIGCLQVSANGFAQEKKVTLKMENATLRKLFLTLEKQTDYRFVYSNNLLSDNMRVDIDVKEEPIGKVLKLALANTALTYRLMENLIVITEQGYRAPALQVRGKVLSEEGEPLVGASVRVKGTNNGTATNFAGEFTLQNVDENAILVISSVGYETVEEKVNGRSTINVTLKILANSLGDVIVEANVGYYKVPRERATGSFNNIGREQLEKPSTNIAQRLIGTTAGMQALSLDADGNPVFQIRGLTSLSTVSQPLVVVDGFPVEGGFSSINPNDVESVTILKDAAAASVWGARAANGVIVISTRNARKGIPLKVELSAFTRVGAKIDLDYSRPLAPSDLTVEYEKMAFNKWSARVNTGSLDADYGKDWSLATVALSEHYLGYITEQERDAILAQLAKQDNRQQIKDYLLANPVNHQINLSLFGSSGKMTNSLSVMFGYNQSNFKETWNKNYMANYRTTASFTKWLDVNMSAMLQYNEAHNNGVDLSTIQGMSPYEMLVNEDGSLTNIHQYYMPIIERYVPTHLFPYKDWTYNPIQEIKHRDLKSTDLNTRIHAGITLKLMRGLTFDSRLQYELFTTTNRNLYGEETYYVRSTVNHATTWNRATDAMTPNLREGAILQQSRTQFTRTVFRNQLNFNKHFGQHEVAVVAGTETNSSVGQTFNHPTTYGYNDKTLSSGTFPNGPGGTFYQIKNWMGSNQTFSYVNTFRYTAGRYFSLYGNASYTFNSKYTISGSVRTDASNYITDDPKYRYSPFWSVGAAWQLYKEKFMMPVTWIDRMSVRLTFGYNGNEDRSTSFKPLISLGTTPNTYTNDYTASVSSYGNPTLRWEKTGVWNLGIDYSLLRGKLYGRFDLYRKYGKDLLATLSIPSVNGTTSQKINNAEMLNRGIEMDLGTTMKIKGNDIVWRGNLNFSYNHNKITKLFVAQYTASTLAGGGSAAYVEGENANSLWRFVYAGIENTQPMIQGPDHTKYDFGAFSPGDGRDYMVNTGTTVAPYTLGFVNSFKVYDFDISFIITGKFGHVFQTLGFNYPPTWTSRVLPNNKLAQVMNGDPMKIVPLPLNDIEDRYYFWDRFHQYLSYLVQSASHIRMQEVNITYNFNRSLLQKLNVGRMMVYAQGNDLFTILANDAGEDPEYRMGTLNPRPKLTMGVKFEF